MNLHLTYCSAKKRDGIHTPDMLYVSNRIASFIDRCRKAEVNWAILSGLYGLLLPKDRKRTYNITFRTDRKYWLGIAVTKDGKKLPLLESKRHILLLAQKLRKQAKEHHVDRIIFFGPSPKMMKCYLGILHYTFDGCSKSHGWRDLIEHVADQSEILGVIHKLAFIHNSQLHNGY